SIMVSKWPEFDKALDFAAEEIEFEKVMELIRAIRNRRAEMNVPPSKKAKVCIATANAETFEMGAKFICRLASASEVEVAASQDVPGAVRVVTDSATAYIPMNELIDFAAELARLNKELAAAEADKEFINKKLNNKGFVEKAPAAVVQGQREQLAKIEEKIQNLTAGIADIEKQM
ncbi:MAG: class I tRNA ligase family protein, partial [Clostridia bacterium]|nr:class I tRNA ligase family protein [Clostridia bacterium]